MDPSNPAYHDGKMKSPAAKMASEAATSRSHDLHRADLHPTATAAVAPKSTAPTAG